MCEACRKVKAQGAAIATETAYQEAMAHPGTVRRVLAFVKIQGPEALALDEHFRPAPGVTWESVRARFPDTPKGRDGADPVPGNMADGRCALQVEGGYYLAIGAAVASVDPATRDAIRPTGRGLN